MIIMNKNYIFSLIFVLISSILFIIMDSNNTIKVYEEEIGIQYDLNDDVYIYQTQSPKYDISEQFLFNNEEFQIKYLDCIEIPEESGDGWFKSFMDPVKITNKKSKQYYYKQFYKVNEDGLYTFNGKYVVAMSANIVNVGDEVIVEFDDGKTINCFVGELKNPQDKNFKGIGHWHKVGNTYHSSIVEFLVDTDKLNRNSLKLGHVNDLISYGNVKEIYKVNENTK